MRTPIKLLAGLPVTLAATLAVADDLDILEWQVPYEQSRPRDPFAASDTSVWFVGQRSGYLAHLDVETEIAFDVEPEAGWRVETQLLAATGRPAIRRNLSADVPVAQNSAIPLSNDIFAYLGGSSHPFAADEVRARYGDRTSFLHRFELAATAAVDAGVLRPREVRRLRSEAAVLWPE